MVENRRSNRRYRVANLQGTLRFAHPATILDLSRTGAAVETAERLVPGRSYPLQLEGPDGLTVTTLGRVVWCKLTGTQATNDGESAPVYRAGLEFGDDLPEPATRLLDRLDVAALEGVATNIRARYKMSDLASTLLLPERASFEVRTLSRGGMGAEMEYSPRVGSTLEFVLDLDEPVEIKGRVADVNPAAGNARRFLVGIEFVGITPPIQVRLESYLDRLRTQTPPED
jgi:hypothetical protein